MNKDYNSSQLFITILTFTLLIIFILAIFTSVYFEVFHPIKYYEVTTTTYETIKSKHCSYDTMTCLYKGNTIDVITIKEVRK